MTDRTETLSFQKPGLLQRWKSMLGVDFYRLFHTPVFYIFLVISAVIPALILGMANGADGTEPLYTNTWQMIAADTPLYAVSSISEYANMNMVFLFGGILLSVFIGHDYSSGYVKQLFTTHPKKSDYMISKTLTGAFSMACMCVMYLLATVLAGAVSGTSFAVDAGSLVCALVGKLLMCLGWSSFYTFVNILFRRYFGISVALCFFFGTGIPIIAAGMLVGNTSVLNIFLYGSSVYACLSSGPSAILVCLVCSAAWSVIWNALGTLVLSRTDVY